MSRLSGQPHHRPATADAVMSSSFHGVTSSPSHNNDHNHLLDMTKSLIENFTSDSLMTQSLDPTILNSPSNSMNTSMTSSIFIRDSHPSPTNNGNLYNEQSHIPVLHSCGPLVTASKMMPVPESLMSPDCGPSSVLSAPQQQVPRPLSGLTTSISNTIPSVRTTTKLTTQQQQRPSSSPAAATKSSSRINTTKKQEKTSPSNSPRKAIMNTANTKIHQNQSILKNSSSHPHHQQQHVQHEIHQQSSSAVSSVVTTEDEDEDECDRVNVEKLKSIKKVAQKNQKQLENHHQQVNKASIENKEAEKSAIMIQKIWRGYSTRKQTLGDVANALQQKRTNDYILKLTQDMEMTKQALENERKIQQLQMQAINALWKKVSSMQGTENAATTSIENGTGSDSTNIVHDLSKTCSVLSNQVSSVKI